MATAAPHAALLIKRALVELRRLRLDRALMIVAALTAIVLVLVETPLVAVASIPLPLTVALVALQAGGIVAAVRTPNVAAPVSLIAVLGLQAFSESSSTAWPWTPVLIVTQTLVLAAVATRTILPVAFLHWGLAVGSSAVLAAVLRPADAASSSVDLVVFGGVSAAAIVVALLSTQWRRVQVQLLRERRIAADASAARLVAEERTRIARELHDVVAHSLSIITVQASTARFRHADIGSASEEFDRIAAQSRQALDEMRGLLRVLRGSGDDERHPQPGLGDIPGLVAGAAETGTCITLEEPGDRWAEGLSALTGLTAYRIVQEATSNALRHAAGSAVAVRLARLGSDIEVVVTNTAGREETADGDRHGHGLVGMRERAASTGGVVRFGPTTDGGFEVRAVLPVHPSLGGAA